MQETIIDLISQHGYLGVALLIAIENIFPPIPSEIILTFAGFMTLSSNLEPIGLILSATIGATIGALILYSIGRFLSTDRLNQFFASKYGSWLGLKPTHIAKATEFFIKYENRAIFLGRFVPIVRSLISIPAGITKCKLRYFIPLTFLGTLIWNTVLIYLGAFAGNAWAQVAATVDIFATVVGIILLILSFLGIYKLITLNKNKKND
ncbi:DedA family protein [Dellaglioa sp. L3N]